MSKPKYLYHASDNKGVDVFKPKNKTVRDKSEGKVVFASPSKTYASMFIVPARDSWATNGRFGNRFWIVVSDKKGYLKNDRGGAIYSLPADKFNYSPNKGTSYLEWTSKEPVKPIDKEVYDSGLEAMMNLGVEVYFVDKNTFKDFKKAEKQAGHGESFIDKLKPES